MKNQNLNVGDKLLCKKSLSNKNKTVIYLIEFKYYYIVDICIYEDGDYIYSIYSICCDISYQIINFKYEDEFYEYFYRKNEIRKIKLNKLINE